MRVRLDIDYARALRNRLRAVTYIYDVRVLRDNICVRARPTRWSLSTVKTPQRDALSTNRSNETVWGIYEYNFIHLCRKGESRQRNAASGLWIPGK